MAKPAGYVCPREALILTHHYLRDAARRISPRWTLLYLISMGLSWLCTIPYLWWQPFDSWSLRAGYGLPVLVIALLSGRTNLLFSEDAFHHWGVFIGPAQMVWQGEWLLWDVPSQYGFLSILTIADAPGLRGLNIWQSLYTMNALALFLSATFIFLVLRALHPGMLNRWFALLITLAAVFWLPGDAGRLTGPYPYPSMGGFRFLWFYALLTLLVWRFRRHPTSHAPWGYLLAGCAIWLLGAFWSFESAVYCTMIWGPAYLVLLCGWIVSRREAGDSRTALARGIVLRLLTPILLLTATLGLVTLYYRLNLGHGPDWVAYIEYTFSFTGGGFGTLPINHQGPVWTLLLVLIVLVATIAYLLRPAGRVPFDTLALALGTLGGFWAICSYYIGRSADNTATGIAPVVVAALGITLLILAHGPEGGPLKGIIRASLAPVLVMLLLVTIGSDTFWREYLPNIQGGYQPHIERQVPVMSQSLSDLLILGQVQANDPLIGSYDSGIGDLPYAWHPVGTANGLVTISPVWLPSYPWTALFPLSHERRSIYGSR